MSEEALQIAEERREVKRKGEREKYTQLNADFMRIAKRVIRISNNISDLTKTFLGKHKLTQEEIENTNR